MEENNTLIILITTGINALVGAIFRAIEKRKLRKKGILKDLNEID